MGIDLKFFLAGISIPPFLIGLFLVIVGFIGYFDLLKDRWGIKYSITKLWAKWLMGIGGVLMVISLIPGGILIAILARIFTLSKDDQKPKVPPERMR